MSKCGEYKKERNINMMGSGNQNISKKKNASLFKIPPF